MAEKKMTLEEAQAIVDHYSSNSHGSYAQAAQIVAEHEAVKEKAKARKSKAAQPEEKYGDD